MEVEVKPPLNWGLTTSPMALKVPNSVSDREQGVPHFLCEDIDAEYSNCDLDGIKIFFLQFIGGVISSFFRDNVQKNEIGD